jgi:hypothetical protein
MTTTHSIRFQEGDAAMHAAEKRAMRHGHKPSDRWEFHALVALTYPLFLLVALASRLSPRRPRFLPTSVGGRRSVFAEARAAAHTTLPFAFMG